MESKLTYSVHAGIIYEITPYNGTILVWAGVTQMNPVVLESIPTSTMAVYFLAWTPNLLSVPQFIWTLPPTDQCTNNCVTYIQPGGVEIARLWSKDLNQTLLQNGHFDLADVIQIYNAPAIVTEFDEPTDDLIFQTGECELFTPLSNDAIYICIKPAEFGTAVIGRHQQPKLPINSILTVLQDGRYVPLHTIGQEHV